MSKNTELRKTGILILAVLTVVGMFTFIMYSRQSAGSLTIKTGDTEFVMDFSDNNLNFSDLIRESLNDETRRQDVLAILKDSYGFYHKDSELLVDYFRRAAGDSVLATRLRELLMDLRGPFARQYHHYYDIQDIDVVDAINALGFEHVVAQKFRELRDNAKGIFEYKGIDVDVDFGSADLIPDRRALVCKDNYKGRDLLLLNPTDFSRSITVFARGNLLCGLPSSEAGGGDRFTIRINHNDAKKLFGDKTFSAKEEAILYLAPSGFTAVPQLVTMSD